MAQAGCFAAACGARFARNGPTKVVERYLDQGDGAKREQLHGMFRAAAAREEPVDLDAALKMYGEEVVTAVGDEVDRIEKAIVRVEPSIHYVDLETN